MMLPSCFLIGDRFKKINDRTRSWCRNLLLIEVDKEITRFAYVQRMMSLLAKAEMSLQFYYQICTQKKVRPL